MGGLLVTGALGHIGSALIRKLPAFSPVSEIVLLDNLSTQRYASLFDLPAAGRYRFVEADIRSADWGSLLSGIGAVIHLAAITDAPSTVGREQEVQEVNRAGTERLARACRERGAPLLFLSTTSVYGPQSEVVDEDCPASDLRPQSPYARSKLDAEEALRSEGARGLKFVICRFGTIFGTSIGMRFHTAVNKFCWQAAMGQPLTVWKTALDQKRPYLDLQDAIGAVELLLKKGLFDNRVYNVLTLNATAGEVVEAIRARRPSLRVELVDSPIMNQLSYTVSDARFRALGFRPQGSLDRGVRDTLDLLRGSGPGKGKAGG